MHSLGRNFTFTFYAVLALWLAMLTACSSSSDATCVPGQSIACARRECTDGYQVCAADGRSYSTCTCTKDREFPQTGPHSGLLGATCTSPANCRTGLDCIPQDSNLIRGEGPSAGLCLAPCIPEHDFCADLDAHSRCIVLDDGGTPKDTQDDLAYCLPGCELGTQPRELDKCRGRADLVCSEAFRGSGLGYCRPACRSDLDCGERHCSLATGLCRDEPLTGNPIGAACNPAKSECAGGCIDHPGGYAECSGVCRYGTPGCGQTSTQSLDYFCYLDPAVGSGEGDLGYCARLCDCDSDCERADAVCEPRPGVARTGICASKTFPSGAIRPNTPCSKP